MRKIKFRGYEPLFKKWAYGHYHPSEGYQVIFDIERSTPSRPYPAIVMHESIGQYTGLKDKNGVEIYEGDILDYSGDKKSVLMFEVIFHHASFKRKWLSEQTIKNRGIEVETLAWNTSVIFEVIGNIYENPELLEESNCCGRRGVEEG